MKQRGFTLIEMMIVVAILGILGALIAPVIAKVNFDFGESMFTAGEIGALAFVLFAGIMVIATMWKLRNMNKKFQEREDKIKAMEATHKRTFPASTRTFTSPPPKRESTYVSTTKAKQQTQVVANNSVGIQGGRDVSYISPSITDEVLTAMVLNQVLHSHSGTVNAKVDYDTETVRVREEPSTSFRSSSSDDTPSYSSSYSSSSSNDDSSSRSSYSSSYSSSSSDSSYSSSSSDSSYSSSSSD